MAYTPATLFAGVQLAAAAASIGGPATPARWWLKRVVFANVDTVTRSITVHRVPAGGSALPANIVIDAMNLPPAGQYGSSYIAAELADMILNPGETLYAFADVANKVNVFASGLVY